MDPVAGEQLYCRLAGSTSEQVGPPLAKLTLGPSCLRVREGPAQQDAGPIIFLDRDGVINENRSEHVKRWSEFQFLPGAREAIARLTRIGARTFVVTNQAAINRNLTSRAAVTAIHEKMVRAIESVGGHIGGVACCPHRPDEDCPCRKPRPGLLLGLAAKHHLNLGAAVMIGDSLADVRAGLAAGCRPILVLTGRGREQLKLTTPGERGFAVVENLGAAADLIIREASVRDSLAVVDQADGAQVRRSG